MKVLLLTRYGRLAPSSRLRSYQYLPILKSAGIDVSVWPLLDDTYVAALYGKATRRHSIAMQYAKRMAGLLRVKTFDLVWVEKEVFPWLPSWFELALLPHSMPIVVDYDDAVFHRYDCNRHTTVRLLLGKKIDRVMRRAQVVTVGNDYLAARARSAGAKDVFFVPTAVDIQKYQVTYQAQRPSNGPVVVGWIGNPVTARHLRLLADSIARLKERFKENLRFVAIGANKEQLSDLPIEVKDWSEEREASDVSEFDIGVMPLPDEPFERGKCGYKLIQYMASCKPVAASPVGVNQRIVIEGETGFLCSTTEEWVNALTSLIVDANLRQRLGLAGRALVEREYSLQVTAKKLVDVFQRFRP